MTTTSEMPESASLVAPVHEDCAPSLATVSLVKCTRAQRCRWRRRFGMFHARLLPGCQIASGPPGLPHPALLSDHIERTELPAKAHPSLLESALNKVTSHTGSSNAVLCSADARPGSSWLSTAGPSTTCLPTGNAAGDALPGLSHDVSDAMQPSSTNSSSIGSSTGGSSSATISMHTCSTPAISTTCLDDAAEQISLQSGPLLLEIIDVATMEDALAFGAGLQRQRHDASYCQDLEKKFEQGFRQGFYQYIRGSTATEEIPSMTAKICSLWRKHPNFVQSSTTSHGSWIPCRGTGIGL